MATEVLPVAPEHVEKLGDICYRAFHGIASSHGFPTDFTSPQMASMIIGSMVRSEQSYCIAAASDGALAGSNFLTTNDEVGAVGPVSVAPDLQGRGIGRLLMQNLLDYARDAGIERVRLMQDSFNMQSLALYASFGFDTRAPCALMIPAPQPSGDVRLATKGDLDAIEALSRDIYRVSRRNEAEQHIGGPMPPHVCEKAGRIIAYFIPGMVGHGAGETEEALVETVLASVVDMLPEMQRVFCPLIEGDLYRRLLAAGCANRKVMNLMSLGPYEAPAGPWLPSVGF
ncbi:MAG TPA: GNAT family N-acetyltransferase [Dehalococcoidia bacterium]|nr:GNAT family N-acetyltransferase [Dehalococcoidia bacterium]